MIAYYERDNYNGRYVMEQTTKHVQSVVSVLIAEIVPVIVNQNYFMCETRLYC